jgi:hypothetical protein
MFEQLLPTGSVPLGARNVVAARAACAAAGIPVVAEDTGGGHGRSVRRVRAAGGRALVQDPAEAIIPGMPDAALRYAGADAIISLGNAAIVVEEALDGVNRAAVAPLVSGIVS